MTVLAHAGGPELLSILVPTVFVIVYRLARGPLPPAPPASGRPRPPR